MKKEFSIYENESGDPYDLIIPLRRTEKLFGNKVRKGPEADPPDGFSTRLRNFFAPRSAGAVKSGNDPTTSGLGTGTSQGQSRSGGPGIPKSSDLTGKNDVNEPDLPGGKGKLNSDGSVRTSDGTDIPAGTRGQNGLVETKYNPAHKGEQHTPAQQRARREKIIDRVTKGTMLLPALLPLGLLLTALIQGEIECDALDDKDHEITSIDSARYPVYPDGTPDFIKNYFAYNKTKVKIRYNPCTNILTTDNIDIKDSNLFDGNYGVKMIEPCVLQLDIGQEYTSNAASNTAYFKLHTDCSDRIMYNLGEDIGDIANLGASSAQGLLGGLIGSIPWSTIFFIILCLVAVWFFFSFAKAVT